MRYNNSARLAKKALNNITKWRENPYEVIFKYFAPVLFHTILQANDFRKIYFL